MQLINIMGGILAVSSISAALAAMLVIAGRYLNNYGECTITINGNRELKVEGGTSLLESLNHNKIFIPSACGGRGTCAYCKLQVLEGAGPLLPTEEPYLDDTERSDNTRLSCQVKVKRNLTISIPEEMLSVREYRGTCTAITQLTDDMREFRIKLNDPGEMPHTPGQYIQLFCPSYDDNEEVYRAYSIASDAEDTTQLALLIKLVPGGICTTWCFEHLKEGDEVMLNGPYGEFRLSDTDAPMIFVAGGSGMAPMEALLYQMQATGSQREVIYFFGANQVEQLFHAELMRKFESALPNMKYVPVVAHPGDTPWDGETGLVTEALSRNFTNADGAEGYLCGSPGMIDAAIEVMHGIGISEDAIYYDKFE